VTNVLDYQTARRRARRMRFAAVISFAMSLVVAWISVDAHAELVGGILILGLLGAAIYFLSKAGAYSAAAWASRPGPPEGREWG